MQQTAGLSAALVVVHVVLLGGSPRRDHLAGPLQHADALPAVVGVGHQVDHIQVMHLHLLPGEGMDHRVPQAAIGIKPGRHQLVGDGDQLVAPKRLRGAPDPQVPVSAAVPVCVHHLFSHAGRLHVIRALRQYPIQRMLHLLPALAVNHIDGQLRHGVAQNFHTAIHGGEFHRGVCGLKLVDAHRGG